MNGSSIRFTARMLLVVATVGMALISLGGLALGTHPFLIVPAALFVVALVLLSGVASGVAEVLQKQAERIQTLEQLLGERRPGQI